MKKSLGALVALALALMALGPLGVAFAAQDASARTSIAGAASAQINNIELSLMMINGVSVPSGASFSFNELVGPYTKAYGYRSALNGRGAKVTGGGVAQVATTLYLALLESGADVSYDSFESYGGNFTGNYVADGAQAVIVDYAAGTDFSFTNLDEDMYIEMWTTDRYLYCSVSFGVAGEDIEWSYTNDMTGYEPAASVSFEIDGGEGLINNIALAASSINDTVLCEGDLFSFNDIVGPRTEYYGYEAAVNGRGVRVVGGGVAQVASAVWLAIKKLDCVAIVEKSTYGKQYSQSYVSSSNDAILTDYNNDTDFSFRNMGAAPMTICTYIVDDALFCDIYLG